MPREATTPFERYDSYTSRWHVEHPGHHRVPGLMIRDGLCPLAHHALRPAARKSSQRLTGRDRPGRAEQKADR
jgi:hypothetical protein